MDQKTEYNNAYERIKNILEYSITNNNLIIIKHDIDILKNKIKNLKNGNLIYNTNDPFLGRCKQCVGIDYDAIDKEIEILYKYALNYDIFMAPKTVTFGVTIKQSKYWL
jgi:hypothetical protein